MSRAISNIARNTFRELVRSRFLSVWILFGAVIMAFGIALGSLSMGQSERLVFDFGIAMMEIFGLLCIVFVAGQMLQKEFEWRTLYLILSKPIGRSDFVLGKFFGFLAILLYVLALESLAFGAVLYLSHFPLSWDLVFSVVAVMLKLAAFLSVTLFFSTFASPITSMFLAVWTYVASHSASTVLDMGTYQNQPALAYLGRFLYAVFPNFEALSQIRQVPTTHVSVSIEFIASNALHALVYVALMLVFSVLAFRAKSFDAM